MKQGPVPWNPGYLRAAADLLIFSPNYPSLIQRLRNQPLLPPGIKKKYARDEGYQIRRL
jgi:hypothetical protein